MSSTEATETTQSDAAGDVAWDLEPLLRVEGLEGDGDLEGVDALLDAVDEITIGLEAYRGHIAELDAAGLAELHHRLDRMNDLAGRVGNYVMLRFSANTADAQIAAQMQRVQERLTIAGTRLVFIELEWADLDDARVDELLADPALDFVAHHLRSARRYRPHLLSEAEEVVLTEKSVAGAAAWSRLFDEQSSAITVDLPEVGEVPLDAALSRLDHFDRDHRRATAEAISAALQPGLRTRGYIYNTLLVDKSIDDRLRSYPTWISARNLSNEASDESVAALLEAVAGRYHLPQRWYTLKAQVMGLDRLADYDRYATLAEDQSHIGWDEATEMVLDAYGSFSPQMADVVREFLSEPWIDAPVRPSKRGGAFCAYTVPSHHPYLLLNWTSKRRDVLTLAHELGHGIHAYLSRPQGTFHQSTPLTLAETASVFGETVTFGRLLEDTADAGERFALLAANLEDQIATVFRQVAMCQFEAAVHTERREAGELSLDRFGDLWVQTQGEMLGDSVELTEGYRNWWSYIPHFIHTPGYVYAYAYGQLLALSVYARYQERGEAFVPSYVGLLSAGGSMPPEALGAIVGCDLADPGFWDGGLDIIESRLAATEAAAKEAGRLPAD